MTDFEKLTSLLAEFGVGYDVKENSAKGKVDGSKHVVCEKGNEKIGGYIGFITFFDFDCNGKFIRMGAWE